MESQNKINWDPYPQRCKSPTSDAKHMPWIAGG